MANSINILQLEAKDLVIDGDIGFEIKSDRRYKATLDYSLESIKLEMVHKKVYRNNRFTFKKGNKWYSNDVISVQFTYRTEDLSTDQLREKLYNEGFNVEGNHYVRFKRSGGSARVGKCLFIREEMFKDIMKWSYMGLRYKVDDPLDLASIEAYIALTTSSIIDTIEIEPRQILLIDDYDSEFEDKVMVTRIAEDNTLTTNEEVVEVNNSIWDGQSLMDSSLFEEKYSDKGMLLLRNRFFKSACFNTDIQKYFIDNDITDVSQLNGKTLATDIKDIKLITTPSSIKYLKFDTFDAYMSQLESTFGVVKYDKPTHFFDGELVQTHYQLLNTLEFSYDETEQFLEDTLEYIRMLKQELPVLRYQLKMNINQNLEVRDISTTNDFIYTMLQVNDKIRNTSMFSKFRTDLINSYVLNVRKGHVLVKGNYSVLLGNGIEMLKASINKFNGSSELGIDEVHNLRFDFEIDLLGIRSPHVTMGNVWVIKNKDNNFYNTYFNLSKQILCVNSIGNNMLERLNGADFDSDAVMLTDNKMLVDKEKQNYDKFLVPTSLVESTKAVRLNNSWHRYDLDKKTSVNIIGEIINLSQILNSHLWELKKQGRNYQEVYKDISKLAVMSCIEIDKAKKEFVIDNVKELKMIREKYPELIKEKPMFFYHLPSDEKLHIVKNKDKHRFYDTTMDHLQKIMTKRVRKIRCGYEDRFEIKDLFNNNEVKLRDADYAQAKIVLDMSEILRVKCNALWVDDTISKQDRYFSALDLKDEFIKTVSSMSISISTLKKIIHSCDSKNQRKMMSSLFVSHKDIFIELVNKQRGMMGYAEKNQSGDSYMYGIPFKINKKRRNS